MQLKHLDRPSCTVILTILHCGKFGAVYYTNLLFVASEAGPALALSPKIRALLEYVLV